MADQQNAQRNATGCNQPVIYQIAVRGHLGGQWADWFGDAVITLTDDGDTLLTCTVADQSALYGVLKQIRDLGMMLVSVNPVGPDAAETSSQEN